MSKENEPVKAGEERAVSHTMSTAIYRLLAERDRLKESHAKLLDRIAAMRSDHCKRMNGELHYADACCICDVIYAAESLETK